MYFMRNNCRWTKFNPWISVNDFQIENAAFRVPAIIFGNRLHISEVAAPHSNESIVRFFGFFNNSEDCSNTEIVATNIQPGNMQFEATTKTPDGRVDPFPCMIYLSSVKRTETDNFISKEIVVKWSIIFMVYHFDRLPKEKSLVGGYCPYLYM